MQPLHLSWLEAAGVEAAILRLELLDPLLSGNKWFKLKGHLRVAEASGSPGLISVGGAHSNHLHALAAAGQRFGFATVGLLRGELQDTVTVADLQAMGMQLHWLGYGEYRQRHQASFWLPWLQRYSGYHPVPEGGGGLLGTEGCAAIVDMIDSQLADLGWSDYQQLWLAVGSGTTLVGLQLAMPAGRELVGALAVPARYGVGEQIEALLQTARVERRQYRLLEACGAGFGRFDQALLDFMQDCEVQSCVQFEPIYSSKMLLALQQQVAGGYLAAGSRVVLLHGGGLQGYRPVGPDEFSSVRS
ncbi:1-aminocyclopropane-1-carboxylate deaminase [Pseudomonas fluvialis]|uniref:1-aminocyclopropane-1-carboxylate deaminase n=1 Tax=Pseudomonas fluvialis TaxID=1793966 RepID=A0A7X0BSL0_9PSED|nr:pyridoxal-phosphate dependent enzyme [Pseudomonas fluvialis]MBB6341887.1 1-aminocyclopropane-1-carboxylate deaminase [Pseudomonas fluvialis]